MCKCFIEYTMKFPDDASAALKSITYVSYDVEKKKKKRQIKDTTDYEDDEYIGDEKVSKKRPSRPSKVPPLLDLTSMVRDFLLLSRSDITVLPFLYKYLYTIQLLY